MMKINSSRIKISITGVVRKAGKAIRDIAMRGISEKLRRQRMRVLSIILVGAFGGIAADTCEAGVLLVGPRITEVNFSGYTTSALGQMIADGTKVTGNIVYGELGSAAWKATQASVGAGVVGNTAAGTVSTIAKKWLPLAIPGGAVCTLTRVAIEAGLMIGCSYLAQYAAERGLAVVDGLLRKVETVNVPTDPACRSWWEANQGTYAVVANATAACEAACSAKGDTNCCSNPAAHSLVNDTVSTPCGNYWYWGYGDSKFIYGMPFTTVSNGTSPMTSTQVENDLNQAMSGATPSEAGKGLIDTALGHTGAALTNANMGWPYQPTNNWGPFTPSQGQSIQNIYNNAITNNQVDQITNQGDTNITNNIVINDPNKDENAPPPKEQKTLTQKEVQDAVHAGIDDAGHEAVTLNGIDAPPPEQPPEKKSLTGVMGNFVSALGNLPLFSWLQGQVPSSGNECSYIDLPKGSLLGGGYIRVDFADYQSLIDFLGNALLSVVGLCWSMWLFRGRGEG